MLPLLRITRWSIQQPGFQNSGRDKGACVDLAAADWEANQRSSAVPGLLGNIEHGQVLIRPFNDLTVSISFLLPEWCFPSTTG